MGIYWIIPLLCRNVEMHARGKTLVNRARAQGSQGGR